MQCDSTETVSFQAETKLWAPSFDSHTARHGHADLAHFRTSETLNPGPLAPLQTCGSRTRGLSGAPRFGNLVTSKTSDLRGGPVHSCNCQGAQGPGNTPGSWSSVPEADTVWCLGPDCSVLSPHANLSLVTSLSASCTRRSLANLRPHPLSSPRFTAAGNHGFRTPCPTQPLVPHPRRP